MDAFEAQAKRAVASYLNTPDGSRRMHQFTLLMLFKRPASAAVNNCNRGHGIETRAICEKELPLLQKGQF